MRPEERTRARETVEQLVATEGYEILRLSVSTDRVVVLTLDADPGPITIKDCTLVNRRLRRALEESGLDVDEYAIEVESPGVRRALRTSRHFERFVGERARIRLVEPDADGQEILLGTIDAVEGEELVLQVEDGAKRRLGLDEVAKARLDPRY